MEMNTDITYRIGIVDDRLEELNIIQHYIAEDPSLKIVFSLSDPVQAFNLLEQQEIDILILDMEMQPMNGVELLEALKVMPKVIVCSNHPEYTYQTSPYQSAFIKKTVGREMFRQVIENVKQQIDISEHSVELNDKILDIRASKSAGYHIQINTERLMFAEINDKTMCFYKDNPSRGEGKMYFTKHGNIKMERLEELLDQDQFVRVHRSFVVNMAYVENYSAEHIHIKGVNMMVPIGKTYRKDFMEKIEKYRKKNRC